jgi:hypothetical protein
MPHRSHRGRSSGRGRRRHPGNRRRTRMRPEAIRKVLRAAGLLLTKYRENPSPSLRGDGLANRRCEGGHRTRGIAPRGSAIRSAIATHHIAIDRQSAALGDRTAPEPAETSALAWTAGQRATAHRQHHRDHTLAKLYAVIGISTSVAARCVDSPSDHRTIARPCRDRRRKRLGHRPDLPASAHPGGMYARKMPAVPPRPARSLPASARTQRRPQGRPTPTP